MPYRVSFEMWGEGFRPSRVPFRFTKQHDSGAIGTVGRYRGEPLPYGSASYVVPASVPNADRIKHAVQIIEPLLAGIRDAGATDWHISIGRYCSSQCNEAYSLEELQLIARRYEADLFCGVFLSWFGHGFSMFPALHRKLADRNPLITFRIYPEYDRNA